MQAIPSFQTFSDVTLSTAVLGYAQDERSAAAVLVAALAEFDRRRLYFDHGCNSLFAFCIQVLHLSEHAAYARVEAARSFRKFPSVLPLLQDGSLTITNFSLLARHLTESNHQDVINEARHKRKEEVMKIVARLRPQPDVPSVVRNLPAPVTVAAVADPPVTALALEPSAPSAPARVAVAAQKPAVIAPLAPDRYKIQVTVDQETRNLLRQAQDLMRHTLPSGDPAVVIARALRVLVADLLKKKAAVGAKPRRSAGVAEGARDIPAAVMREVWNRDRGRCAHVGPHGRCNDGGFVEFHHVIPHAMGGQPSADNIELRCRAHNAHQAELDGLGFRLG